MFAARTVQISETDAGATVATQCRYPPVAIAGFLFKGVLWFGTLVIFGGGAFGFISPETATLPIRVFAVLFTVLWAALGLWNGTSLFRRAFARSEFQASESGFRIRHASVLGISQRDYSWDQVELFTEVVTEGEFDHDLAMIVCGRHVALDYSLPPKSATQAVAALSRWLEEYHQKRANPQGGANRSQPVRSETNSASPAPGSGRSP
jgi:hypothetical protein